MKVRVLHTLAELGQTDEEWAAKSCFDRRISTTVISFLEDSSCKVKKAAVRVLGALFSTYLADQIQEAVLRDDVLTYLYNFFDYETFLQKV